MNPNLNSLLKPERVFLVLAIIFGITFLIITPPFQSPDENRHFLRAYHISQGSISATKTNGRVGGFLPKKVRQSIWAFKEVEAQVDKKTSKKEIFSAINAEGDNSLEFVDFPSVAVYTTVSYIPQAIGIRIGKLFSDSPILALYAGRLFALFCWIVALFYAIRITPILKWLFVVLALLPMSIYISASVSSDTVTNAIVFLLIATFFKQAFTEEKQSKKDFYWLGLLVILLASAKFIYSPLILLFFLIPFNKFDNKRQYFLRFFALGGIALLTTLCWPLIQGVGYVPYADYNSDYVQHANLLKCSNIHDQLDFMKHHFGYTFKVIWNSVIESFDMYYTGFIGNFGWLESPLSSFWVAFGYVGLILVALIDGKPEVRVSYQKRGLVFGTFGILFSMVIISQLLIWTCVGHELVGNLQGRYFTPMGPLFFFIFYRSRNRFAKYLPIGVILFSVILLVVSARQIYHRFYIPLQYETVVVRCDHERGGGTSDFKTNHSEITARNAHTRSGEEARSGKYSSKISPKQAYGTLIEFEDVNGGETIEVEAWRFGPHGKMVVSTIGNNKLFTAIGDPDTVVGDWQRVRFKVIIPSNCENEDLSIYPSYFEESGTCYFDDIKITYRRLK